MQPKAPEVYLLTSVQFSQPWQIILLKCKFCNYCYYTHSTLLHLNHTLQSKRINTQTGNWDVLNLLQKCISTYLQTPSLPNWLWGINSVHILIKYIYFSPFYPCHTHVKTEVWISFLNRTWFVLNLFCNHPATFHTRFSKCSVLTAIRIRLWRNKLYSYSMDRRRNEVYEELHDWSFSYTWKQRPTTAHFFFYRNIEPGHKQQN